MHQRIHQALITRRVIGAEHAARDRMDGLCQFPIAFDHLGRIVPACAFQRDFFSRQAKDHDVVAAHALHDFNIGAIQRADRQRAVQRKFHITRARCFHARGRNLLRQIGCRNDLFCKADIVIGNEHHFEQLTHGWIGIDPAGDIIGQFDDEFGRVIGGRCLAAKNLHPRHPVAFGMAADLIVKRHCLNQVQKLAFVFVDAFDLHIEQSIRIKPDAGQFTQVMGKINLVGALDLVHPLAKGFIIGQRHKTG